MPVENGKVCDYTEKHFCVHLFTYFIIKKNQHVTSGDFGISITWRGEISHILNSISYLGSKMDLTYSHFSKDFFPTWNKKND